jgi:hypothetical protein
MEGAVADLFPGSPPAVSLTRQVECLERELRMRERTYPRWVAAGKMSQSKADEELAAMQAALDTVCKLSRMGTQKSGPSTMPST